MPDSIRINNVTPLDKLAPPLPTRTYRLSHFVNPKRFTLGQVTLTQIDWFVLIYILLLACIILYIINAGEGYLKRIYNWPNLVNLDFIPCQLVWRWNIQGWNARTCFTMMLSKTETCSFNAHWAELQRPLPHPIIAENCTNKLIVQCWTKVIILSKLCTFFVH